MDRVHIPSDAEYCATVSSLGSRPKEILCSFPISALVAVCCTHSPYIDLQLSKTVDRVPFIKHHAYEKDKGAFALCNAVNISARDYSLRMCHSSLPLLHLSSS
jgi:hypothetical protein